MKIFKPYVYVGAREENNGETYKLYEIYVLSKWGYFINKLLGRERYPETKEVCRVIMGKLDE
jgi:hypothetical protein